MRWRLLGSLGPLLMLLLGCEAFGAAEERRGEEPGPSVAPDGGPGQASLCANRGANVVLCDDFEGSTGNGWSVDWSTAIIDPPDNSSMKVEELPATIGSGHALHIVTTKAAPSGRSVALRRDLDPAIVMKATEIAIRYRAYVKANSFAYFRLGTLDWALPYASHGIAVYDAPTAAFNETEAYPDVPKDSLGKWRSVSILLERRSVMEGFDRRIEVDSERIDATPGHKLMGTETTFQLTIGVYGTSGRADAEIWLDDAQLTVK